jgi:hypothetical protein
VKREDVKREDVKREDVKREDAKAVRKVRAPLRTPARAASGFRIPRLAAPLAGRGPLESCRTKDGPRLASEAAKQEAPVLIADPAESARPKRISMPPSAAIVAQRVLVTSTSVTWCSPHRAIIPSVQPPATTPAVRPNQRAANRQTTAHRMPPSRADGIRQTNTLGRPTSSSVLATIQSCAGPLPV